MVHLVGKKEKSTASLICGCALHLVPICLCGQVGRRGLDNTPSGVSACGGYRPDLHGTARCGRQITFVAVG
jgi:hypothetical protein